MGVSPFVRKVRTSSGATAVQIVEKIRGQRKILEHIGSAHTEGELAALIAVARGKITAGQQPWTWVGCVKECGQFLGDF